MNVEILVGAQEGRIVPVLSTDRWGVVEVRLVDGSVAYYDKHEVDAR